MDEKDINDLLTDIENEYTISEEIIEKDCDCDNECESTECGGCSGNC